jgi:hypothetical protein
LLKNSLKDADKKLSDAFIEILLEAKRVIEPEKWLDLSEKLV